ncbi:biopolymer transporter ExbD [Marivibrio halodurans]|uniref:Biopolymer transporter ExbD n=1 Tax=Marivibrio halodurans TaxID=2039722 RepID=A0A8J7SNB0_9PROT|nr:biopolymer transporter ExbD [Marivibrio halodurans]MBP5857541.1 biopolymer transporter ExbD [Marivibrio halodurans]
MRRQATVPPRLVERGRPRRALISLTPLIDVVFILLVFFMLASSFLDWRSISLETPRASSGGGAMEGAVLLEIRADDVRLSGQSTTLDGAIAALRQRLAERPDLRAFLRPDDGVSLQRTIEVLDRVDALGLREMSLVGAPGR